MEDSEVSLTDNIGRCQRCRKFMIQEEMTKHQCDYRDIQISDAQELLLDHLTDLGVDRNGDHIYIAWGLDGIFYRLVECKHNPPHATKRKFTGCGTKQGLDRASARVLYSLCRTLFPVNYRRMPELPELAS